METVEIPVQVANAIANYLASKPELQIFNELQRALQKDQELKTKAEVKKD